MASQEKTKSEIMRAIMKHKGTSKMFRDAIKSPLGSTSREKTQKVFNIMNKLRSSYDGAGGPGIMAEQQDLLSMPISQDVSNKPKNMVVV